MKIVGRLTTHDATTVLLYRKGYFVHRADTNAVVCHWTRLRRLAEVSPKVKIEEEITQ